MLGEIAIVAAGLLFAVQGDNPSYSAPEGPGSLSLETALRSGLTKLGGGFVVKSSSAEKSAPPNDETRFELQLSETCNRSGISVLPIARGESPTDDPVFAPLAGAPLAIDRGVILVYRGAKRDEVMKNYYTLRFEVVSGKRVPIGAFDPVLELNFGLAGQKMLKSNHRAGWKIVKLGWRRVAISIGVYGGDERVEKLEKISFTFRYVERGGGRPETVADELYFESLPLPK